MAPMAPDFAGFAAAQGRLREHFGHDITFYLPGDAPTYPPGTKVDPESGEPYDPTIEPSTGGEEVETVVRCNVVARPMGLSQRGISPDTERAAIGWVEEGGVVLIIDTEDKAALVDPDAVGFDYAGERYEVRQRDDDFLGPVQRYLIWGKQAGSA